ncbi:MAG: anti-sigma factor [Betaproteobacteria bacterium]|nr:anti-sigma factor [Betaproteobacteria bacterium]
MNSPAQRPTEADFHAYVDGRLEASRRGEIERWLAGHAGDAGRVNAWRRQNEALHARFDGTLEEAVPERLRRAARPQRNSQNPPNPPKSPKSPVWRMAAALVWLGIGTATGLVLRGAPAPAPTLAHHAAIAHAVYTPEVRHPVEVGADQETHLVQWLSKRLGAPLKVPHLAAEGFDLVGGRLLPGDRGAVAQLMYQDAQGRRLTLYVRTDAAENRETAFRYAQEGQIGVFYWLDGRFGYALSGELPREQLLKLSELAYQQLDL